MEKVVYGAFLGTFAAMLTFLIRQATSGTSSVWIPALVGVAGYALGYGAGVVYERFFESRMTYVPHGVPETRADQGDDS